MRCLVPNEQTGVAATRGVDLPSATPINL